MSDLRTFAEEFEQTVDTPSFSVILDRRRRRTRNRLIVAGAAVLTAIATAIGLNTTAGNRAAPVPVQVPKVLQSDWIVLHTPFGLETQRVDGGVSAKIVSRLDGDPHDPSWSRKADRLVWVAYDDDVTQDVWIADSRGAHARRIYDCVAPCQRAWWPQLSPDGGLVAVNTQLEGHRTRHLVVDVATGAAVVLNVGGKVFEISDWSADGTHLLGTLMTITGPESVADRRSIASLDISGIRQGVVHEPKVLVTADVPVWGAAWSPDGRQIAYVQQRGQNIATTDLYVADADGGSPVTAWRAPSTQAVGKPSWGSDGKHVYVPYSVSGESHDGVLARIDTTAGTLTELKDHLGNRFITLALDGG